MIDREIVYLEMNEMLSALKDSWIDSTKEDLKEEFIQDNKEAFEDFCNQAYEESNE